MDMEAGPTLMGHDRYIDRDFSWLDFNARVLAEARDPGNPLLERLKFLSIVANNLDEFFEVRVSGLLQKVESSVSTDGIAHMDCRAKLAGLLKAAHSQVARQYRCWNRELIPELKAKGIHVLGMEDLGPEELERLHRRFRKEIYPLLTPIKVDPAHPFPWVANKALCLGVWLEEDGVPTHGGLGVLAIPRCLPRVIELPNHGPGLHYIFLQDIIKLFLPDLFQGYRIRGSASFRVTRNSNLYMTEDMGNLLDSVEAVVRSRRKGNVVRLEIDADTPPRIRQALLDNFGLEPELVFGAPGPVNLNRLMGLYHMVPLGELKFPPHSPRALRGSAVQDVFARIRAQDILLHHPFESFEPVVEFIRSAARDPDVLCIKQTLYRTSAESSIVYALLEAAERGKEVTAVVELQARFDEKSNIQWARQLQDKGGTVVYGLVGLKTHCKLALVLRREGSGIREYAHIGTGNYHPETAKHYTDLGLLTADRSVTEGISEVFNYLTAHARLPNFPSLLVGPVNLLEETLAMIRAEEDNARKGLPCGITAKMNAIIDAEVIDALYQASQAGVPIRLIVRGICALRPGVPGLSEGIEVRSVLGRFLEHSRIYRFENAGLPLVFIGSGDWMTRNLRERVEVLAMVRHPDIRRRLENVLSVYWADNAKTHVMSRDGTYRRLEAASGEARFETQAHLTENPEARPDARQDLFPSAAVPLAEGSDPSARPRLDSMAVHAAVSALPEA